MTAQLSDELLLAYLDGQLDKPQALGIAQLAEHNPEVTRRLLRLKRTQFHLMETFSAIRQEARPLPSDLDFPEPETEREERRTRQAEPQAAPAPTPAPSEAPRHLPYGKSPLLVVIALAIGLSGGYAVHAVITRPLPGPPKIEDRASSAVISAPRWIADVAEFHAFFPPETLTPHPDAITNPELIRFQLTKVAGGTVAPPDFSKQGYELVRGQVFNYTPGRMMQLTYAGKGQSPLVLYIVPGGEQSKEIAVKHEGFRSIGWGQAKMRFLLAGQKNEDDLKILAMVAQKQISRKN